ncbi:MAG: transglutaminase domain-containing protein [Lentimicrobium sp.]|jgi:transglutaminase-like putative cysteine protease|nr:transglutaminase domain-containing protein [Lentimicrobium sp.]
MMKKYLTFLLIIHAVLGLAQQPQPHLITDQKYREKVHARFLEQRELASGRDSVLFSIMNADLTIEESGALEFLYAYMPLSDLSMYDGSYYLGQVKSALEARSFFKWGKTIPEAVFLHFVLPYRVNNEYTDTARQVFLAEIKDRIKDMNMAEAALEVNHWCHEKVIYKGTDIRTSGPLTTVRTAFGRCGEESTFTVAAMRAVGIPARQVYTPRWAHTDDNHAWVEVWVDGKWSYLGACEPEPELNVGWFSEPVKRAMMTHTFVFGEYRGNEEAIERSDHYARLNLLKNYTNTRSLAVKVMDSRAKPIEGAKVEFGLYNYAEFYPIAIQFTDKNGCCAITTGYGDLLIHAQMGGKSASMLARANLTDTLSLTIADETLFFPAGQYLLTPPPRQGIATPDQDKLAANNLRLLEEDSIRNVYVATFIDSLSAARLLKKDEDLNINKLWNYLSLSRGNWEEILTFIQELSPGQREHGVQILEQITEKDLHDIQASTLRDHLLAQTLYPAVSGDSSSKIYLPYILSPRIGREFITPWRSFIQRYFIPEQIEKFRSNPVNIRNWIAGSIQLDTIHNYYGVPLSIEGMLQLGRADSYSRDLLFVAIGRSFGIPARLETATQRPQFLMNGEWNDVLFSMPSDKQPLRGALTLNNLSKDPDFIPGYYTHYTIARYDQGSFVTLDYETDPRLLSLPVTLPVDTGFYRLITGNRGSEGEVMCDISYFKVEANKTAEAGIRLASATEKAGPVGSVDLNAGFIEWGSDKPLKLNNYWGESGLIVAIIDPAKEPTKHLMEDLRTVKNALDQWGGRLIFTVANDKLSSDFNPKIYKDLPVKIIFGHDIKGEIAAAVSKVCGFAGAPQWPVIALINSKGEIVWYSEGYSIGLGDQLVKQIKKM